MAIIVEEQKPQRNWLSIAIGVLVIAIIVVLAYFLFFSSTPLINIVAPLQLQSTAQLSAISFNPADVVESPVFKVLRRYPGLTVPTGTLGRTNPFAPF
ncbi:MAG: hypothetical protein HYS43_00310 [Candidatus Liptonbacteria bacterium]|nr:hypothetical protein [Candidatus Liptonbacteria bacterium]